jgi:hypothetical protein
VTTGSAAVVSATSAPIESVDFSLAVAEIDVARTPAYVRTPSARADAPTSDAADRGADANLLAARKTHGLRRDDARFSRGSSVRSHRTARPAVPATNRNGNRSTRRSSFGGPWSCAVPVTGPVPRVRISYRDAPAAASAAASHGHLTARARIRPGRGSEASPRDATAAAAARSTTADAAAMAALTSADRIALEATNELGPVARTNSMASAHPPTVPIRMGRALSAADRTATPPGPIPRADSSPISVRLRRTAYAPAPPTTTSATRVPARVTVRSGWLVASTVSSASCTRRGSPESTVSNDPLSGFAGSNLPASMREMAAAVARASGRVSPGRRARSNSIVPTSCRRCSRSTNSGIPARSIDGGGGASGDGGMIRWMTGDQNGDRFDTVTSR